MESEYLTEEMAERLLASYAVPLGAELVALGDLIADDPAVVEHWRAELTAGRFPVDIENER